MGSVTGIGTAAVLVLLAALTALVFTLSGVGVATSHAVDRAAGLTAGALVVTRPMSAVTPRAGDIVALRTDAIGVQQTRFVEVTAHHGARLTVLTSTDASSSVSVPTTEVRGVVWYHLPWIGAVAEGLGSAAGMFYLAALLLVAVAVHLLWATARRPRRSGTRR